MSASLNDQLEAYFRARPGLWIDGRELGTVAGSYGWRTRCSDLRKRGMVIENRVRHVAGTQIAISEYRFVPEAVKVLRAHDLNEWQLR